MPVNWHEPCVTEYALELFDRVVLAIIGQTF
jgi:hypothetical protein